jgi:hypothetical protein
MLSPRGVRESQRFMACYATASRAKWPIVGKLIHAVTPVRGNRATPASAGHPRPDCCCRSCHADSYPRRSKVHPGAELAGTPQHLLLTATAGNELLASGGATGAWYCPIGQRRFSRGSAHKASAARAVVATAAYRLAAFSPLGRSRACATATSCVNDGLQHMDESHDETDEKAQRQ